MPAPSVVAQRVARALHILLVEDHDVTAMMLRMVLLSEGHLVELAADIATALELAQSAPL